MTGLRAFWIVCAATLAVYLAMILWTLPAIARAAGGLRPFDLRPGGYDLAAARAFLEALQPHGRATYAGAQHWLDSVYPALLALTLGWAARLLFRGRASFVAIALALVAMAGAVFDYLENARVAAMLAIGPAALTDELVSAASTATVTKSALTSVVMLGVLAGLAAALFRRWRARRV